MSTQPPILKVTNLCKFFYSGKKHVLKAVNNVSLEIAKGETFGLVGESGCGKTTLGRTIIRLYDPTSGEIHFNGTPIGGKMSKDDIRNMTSKIQMIFQDPVASLNPRMTVEQIICEGAQVNKVFSSKEEMRETMFKILEKVGLTREHATRYPHEFSGGQRQRIGIARAIITNPELIIADEPVSALDVSIQAQVLNLLNDIQKDMGLTILFVAHNLSVVKYFSDRIGVMHKGVLVEVAKSADLYSNPVHPYTKSLLSAIPAANPISERKRKRVAYDPKMHNYTEDNMPEMTEVEDQHFVFISKSELAQYHAQRTADNDNQE